LTAQINLSETARALARSESEKLLAEVAGVTTVVVATVDGFDVASAISGNADAARIAALASSIAAISTVVSEEAELGVGKSVTIDTESGFAIVHAVRRADAELVINVIASSSAILGQVAYRTTQFARLLAAA
jgi:predicted regulator of Ras-like GTPase activity (Roadblock/LC7/MglB family)